MALNLTMVLKVDSAAAKAELDAATRGIKGVTVATGQLGTESRSSASEAKALVTALNLMESESKQNTVAIREMTAALAAVGQQSSLPRVRRDTDAFGQSANQAAGATGNLIAQFNDIGMMMAAGQNPLQLAIQQGTQITQVIGPMGAAGAAKALGGALLGMLNPLSLITLGTIAAGAAMVQWLTSAESGAGAVAAQLERQQAALEAVRAASAETQSEIEKLRFGVDEDYQVELLQEQLRLRNEYNLKVAELNGYLSTTTDSIDRQRINTAGLVAEIQTIVDRNAEISRLMADQQNRSAQLAVLEGIKAQAANELAARLAAAAAEAERQERALAGAYEVYARTRTEANALADEAVRAGLAASGLSLVDFGNIAAGAEAALRMAGNLGIAYAQAVGLSNMYGRLNAGEDERGSQRDTVRGANTRKPEQPWLKTYDRGGWITPPGAGGGKGRGGASEAEKEAKALKDLIDSLEAEIDALREQDPIQREMLKHRQALAGATEAERQKVEELIATREREAMLMEGAKARAQFFEEIGTNALDALINKGESFNDVLKNIISSLIQAVIQAAIFGSGPFGSLFGGKSILSGLIGGGLGGGFGGGKAEGGMVHGEGTGTSDDIPTMLSNGEYVVNAKATARNRALLEAINAGGSLPGFANGGYVGGDSRRMVGRSGSDLPGTIYIDARGSRGNSEIEDMVRKGAAQVVSLYDREGLAVSVQRVSIDPRRRG